MSDLDMAQVYSLISMIGFIAAAGCTVVAVILWFRFKIPEVIRYLTGKSARVSVEKKRNENASKSQSGYHFRLRVGENTTSEQIQIRKSAEVSETDPNLGIGVESTLPLEAAGEDAMPPGAAEADTETVLLKPEGAGPGEDTMPLKAMEADTETVLLKPEGARTGTGTAPLKQTDVPLEQETAPLDQGTAPPDRGTEPLDQGTAPPDRGTEPLDRGTEPLNQGTAPPDRGTKPLDQGTAPLEWDTEMLGTQMLGAAASAAAASEPVKKPGVSFRMLQDIVFVHTDEQIDKF